MPLQHLNTQSPQEGHEIIQFGVIRKVVSIGLPFLRTKRSRTRSLLLQPIANQDERGPVVRMPKAVNDLRR
jgi:hypothetical protein